MPHHHRVSVWRGVGCSCMAASLPCLRPQPQDHGRSFIGTENLGLVSSFLYLHGSVSPLQAREGLHAGSLLLNRPDLGMEHRWAALESLQLPFSPGGIGQQQLPWHHREPDIWFMAIPDPGGSLLLSARPLSQSSLPPAVRAAPSSDRRWYQGSAIAQM